MRQVRMYNPTHRFEISTGPEQQPDSVWIGDFSNVGNIAVWDDTVYVSGTKELVALDTDGNRRWSVSFDVGPAFSSPVVVNDIVYVMDGYNVRALDANLGTEQWHTYCPSSNPMASLAVVDGTVYVPGMKEIFALTVDTGEMLWSVKTENKVGAPPAVIDGNVFVGTYNVNKEPGNSGDICAFDAGTGNLIWRCQTEGIYDSAPTVVDGTVYVGGSKGTVYALEAATGSIEWKQQTDEAVRCSPAVVDDNVYVGNGDTLVYAFDTATGNIEWCVDRETGSHDAHNSQPSPAVVNGILYTANWSGKVYALDAKNGRERWRFSIDDKTKTITMSPVVVDGRLYISANGTNGAVYALGTRQTISADRDRVDAQQGSNTKVYSSAGEGSEINYCSGCGLSLSGYDNPTFCPDCGIKLRFE